MGDLRRERGHETRQKLLFGALELVASSGLQGLTAGKLAAAVGVSKSTIFHHFPSFEQLPIEAMRLWISMILEPMRERTFESLSGYLEALGAAVLSESSEFEEGKMYYRASMAFFHKALCEEAFFVEFSQFLSSFVVGEREVIAALTGLAEDSEVIQGATSLLASTLDGLTMHKALLGADAHVEQAWAQFSEMFLSYMDSQTKEG